MLDDGKVVYGQSFVIYALSADTLATKDPIGLKYAEKTFDLLQKYGTDTMHGGYYENLEQNWERSSPGFDRESIRRRGWICNGRTSSRTSTEGFYKRCGTKLILDSMFFDKSLFGA